MKTTEITYKLTCNKSKKTYTIREYQGNKLVSKYRTNCEGSNFDPDANYWTQNDIKDFLKRSGNYYVVK